MIEFLSPIEDLIFKAIFGKKQNLDILAAFLKSVINIPNDEYSHLELVDTNLRVDYKNDKLGILDIKVYTKSKKIINIEVQVYTMHEMKERLLFYSSKMITEQLDKGESYDSIKQVICIAILDYVLINGNKEYHNIFTLRDEKTNVLFTDTLQIHTLELPKLPDVSDNTELFNWLKFFKAKSEEDFKMLSSNNKELEKAYEELRLLSQNKEMRDKYESRIKAKRDEISRIKSAHFLGKEEGIKEGIKEGKKEGILEGKLDVAKSLLNMNMPIDEIIKVTGLTEDLINEINKKAN